MASIERIGEKIMGSLGMGQGAGTASGAGSLRIIANNLQLLSTTPSTVNPRLSFSYDGDAKTRQMLNFKAGGGGAIAGGEIPVNEAVNLPLPSQWLSQQQQQGGASTGATGGAGGLAPSSYLAALRGHTLHVELWHDSPSFFRRDELLGHSVLPLDVISSSPQQGYAGYVDLFREGGAQAGGGAQGGIPSATGYTGPYTGAGGVGGVQQQQQQMGGGIGGGAIARVSLSINFLQPGMGGQQAGQQTAGMAQQGAYPQQQQQMGTGAGMGSAGAMQPSQLYPGGGGLEAGKMGAGTAAPGLTGSATTTTTALPPSSNLPPRFSLGRGGG
jgi:hypothetical protein